MYLEHLSIVVAACIGFFGVAIMCAGSFKAIYHFLHAFVHGIDRMTEIRIDLVKHLSLGLEFLVAKDIIDTIIEPSFERLLVLGALIVLRTIIAFILSWELKEAAKSIAEELEFEEAVEQFEEAQRHHRDHHQEIRDTL